MKLYHGIGLKALLMMAMTAGVLSLSQLAWAQTTTSLYSPFDDSHGLTVYVTTDYDGTWVGWKDKTNGACVWDLVGDASGLQVYLSLHGGSGNDLISGAIGGTFCGYPIYPPNTNGFDVRIYGGAGNDTLYSLATRTYLQGQDGNDVLISSNNRSVLTGGAGNDTIYATNSGGANSPVFSGNDGNDCLSISTYLDQAIMTCGAGTDTWSGPGTRPSDCESTGSGCCPGLIC